MAAKKKTAVVSPRGGIETPEMAKKDIAGQKKAVTPKKKSKKKATPPPKEKAKDDLETILQSQYPQLAYVLQNPQVFGEDMVDVLRRADTENWTAERLVAAIRQTNYWNTTVAEAKTFDSLTEADKQTKIDEAISEIKGITGVEGIDKTVLNTFARDMARRGVKGDSLKTLTYQFVFNQGMQIQAAQRALFSQDAAEMKRIAKVYGQILTDEQIKTNLSSGKKPVDLQVMYREKLKAQYPHLASQLDADLTFDDITSDYRQIAAQTLERDATTIDFMRPEFMEAIASRDDKGGVRQLSLGEWQQKLRTDNRYGYSKTTQAVREARVLAASLARAFGRIS